MSRSHRLMKVFSGIFTVLLSAAILTACGKKEDDSEEKEEETSSEKASAKGENEFKQGKALYVAQDYKAAITQFALAADQGHAEAQYRVGLCYEEGKGVERDMDEAVKWFKQAAGNDFPEAQLKMGDIIFFGMNEDVDWGNPNPSASISKLEGVDQDIFEGFKWWNKAAKLGNADAKARLDTWSKIISKYEEKKMNSAEAMYELGNSYYFGFDGDLIKKNEFESAKWFHLSACKGNVDAMLKLADFCHWGRAGIKENETWEASWVRKASKEAEKDAEKGNYDTTLKVGKYYMDKGDWALYKKDANEAHQKGVEFCRKAADKGNTEAMNLLGNYYRFFGEDSMTAVKWYRMAADKGNTEAMMTLASIYEDGKDVGKDVEEAMKWIRMAADKGEVAALNRLGMAYFNGKGVKEDKTEAFKCFRKAAEKGVVGSNPMACIYAMKNLAFMYKNGLGVKADMNEAVKWYRKAADYHDTDAMLILARAYENGEGVKRDYAEAVKWLRKAAENGSVTGMNNLGMAYINGSLVKKDCAEGIKWLRQAADEDNATSMFNLGMIYLNGEGVEKDMDEAVKWLRKAADMGISDAEEVLEELGN